MFTSNKLSLNLKKTKCIIFCARNKHYIKTTDIKIDDQLIEQVSSITFRGVHIHEHLDWKPHINSVSLKLSKSIGVINIIKSRSFQPKHSTHGRKILMWGGEGGGCAFRSETDFFVRI